MQTEPFSVLQAFTLSKPRTNFSEIEGYKAPKNEVNPAKIIKER